MPHWAAASPRGRPSSTSAIASIRRAVFASRVRAASRRRSAADSSVRVIATAIPASRIQVREKRIIPTSARGITGESTIRALGIRCRHRVRCAPPAAPSARPCATGRAGVPPRAARTPARSQLPSSCDCSPRKRAMNGPPNAHGWSPETERMVVPLRDAVDARMTDRRARAAESQQKSLGPFLAEKARFDATVAELHGAAGQGRQVERGLDRELALTDRQGGRAGQQRRRPPPASRRGGAPPARFARPGRRCRSERRRRRRRAGPSSGG
jgi:hypothetical protein